jgi:site-specific recombinase XerC
MYNQEQKERFIAEFTTNLGRKKVAVDAFEALGKFEEKWKADFCTRAEEEIKPAVSEIIGIRESSKKTRLSVLRAYVKWCLANDVPNVKDDLLKIKDFGNEKIKHQMVANPQHLQRYLDTVLDKEENKTIDNVFRAYFWLAYSGVKEDDVLNIKSSDVNLSSMTVAYNGKEYLLYREAYQSIKNCIELTAFRFIHPNYSDKEIYKQRASGEILLRATIIKKITDMRTEMSKKQRLQKYRSEVAKDDTSLDLRLSFDRVKLSGMFYRMYEAERAGMPVDFISVADEFMSGKEYKLDSGRNLIGAKQREIANQYRRDYENWKDAFSN